MSSPDSFLLSFDKKLNVRSFLDIKKNSVQWDIEKFSCIKKAVGQFLESPIIKTEDQKYAWSMKMYPFGYSTNDPGYVSFYLDNKGQQVPPMRFELTLLNSKKEVHVKYEANFGTSQGFNRFVNRSYVLDTNNNILSNDTLTILCDVYFSEEVVHLSCEELSVKTDTKLSADLNKILSSTLFTDLTLSVGEREFKVHKVILAARSPVFAAMLSHDMEESATNVVKVPNTEPSIMEEVLRFIYTGKVSDLKNKAEDVMKVANYYDLPVLKELCVEELFSQLTIENAVNMLLLADNNDVQQFKEKIISFILGNSSKIFETQIWKDLMSSNSSLVIDVFQYSFEKRLFFK